MQYAAVNCFFADNVRAEIEKKKICLMTNSMPFKCTMTSLEIDGTYIIICSEVAKEGQCLSKF